VNSFGTLGYPNDPDEGDWTPLEEVLTVLGELVAAGKIRHVGLSNEKRCQHLQLLNCLVQETRGGSHNTGNRRSHTTPPIFSNNHFPGLARMCAWFMLALACAG
jgi:hypothetical protein